jgi:hypothetical protein
LTSIEKILESLCFDFDLVGRWLFSSCLFGPIKTEQAILKLSANTYFQFKGGCIDGISVYTTEDGSGHFVVQASLLDSGIDVFDSENIFLKNVTVDVKGRAPICISQERDIANLEI